MEKKYFIVTYKYVPEMLERRQPHRSEHLAYIQEAQKSGLIVMGGAFADPVDEAVLVMRAETPGELLAWAANDPYARAGLIWGVEVREWTVVVGGE